MVESRLFLYVEVVEAVHGGEAATPHGGETQHGRGVVEGGEGHGERRW